MPGIIEISKTIQGEGLMAGTPGILVRLSGCNLNCQFRDGICDSAYASWRPEDGKYELADIEKMIQDNRQLKYAYVTGGNPSCHSKLLNDIIGLFKKHNYMTSIEDNGTSYCELENKPDLVILSPKLRNSIPVPGSHIFDPISKIDRIVTEEDKLKHEKSRTNYDSMKKWITNYPHQLKFVISSEDQYDEAMEIVDKIGANRACVCFMPEGSNREQLEKRRVWLMEFCIEKGIRYTDRLHIIAYDSLRNH